MGIYNFSPVYTTYQPAVLIPIDIYRNYALPFLTNTSLIWRCLRTCQNTMDTILIKWKLVEKLKLSRVYFLILCTYLIELWALLNKCRNSLEESQATGWHHWIIGVFLFLQLVDYLFRIISTYLDSTPCSFPYRIGALYAMYAVYHTQLNRPKVKVGKMKRGYLDVNFIFELQNNILWRGAASE